MEDINFITLLNFKTECSAKKIPPKIGDFQATVKFEEYNREPIPIIAYGLAGLVGWSRINDNKHWASDVLAGAVLGYEVSNKLISLQ